MPNQAVFVRLAPYNVNFVSITDAGSLRDDIDILVAFDLKFIFATIFVSLIRNIYIGLI